MYGQGDQPGIEPRPTSGISHLTILRGEGVSLLCWPPGDFDSARDPSVGLYYRDTRYLSRFEVLLGNHRLTALDSQERGFWLTATLTNPDILDARGRLVPGQSVVIRRQRVIENGMVEALKITNYAKFALVVPLHIRFACDFEDIFVVRGLARGSKKPPIRRHSEGKCARLEYPALDGDIRVLEVQFSQEPTHLEADLAAFDLDLGPGMSLDLTITATLAGQQPASDPREAIQKGVAHRQGWSNAGTSLESSNPRLDALFRRCTDDLFSLRTRLGARHFIAAGVPWFDALFGRDSLIAGMAALGACPVILRDSLVLLAAEQGVALNSSRDEEPGKIPHELRFGELANIGEVPFGRYYGSIDSTPLFLIACREYVRWTGDLDTVQGFFPAIHRAAAWCARKTESHPLGALAYHRESVNGLEHQGWKDSEDGICHPDGSAVEGPVALIEAQAYLAAAFQAYADICRIAGEAPSVDTALRTVALVDLLRSRFLVDGEAILALDGQGEPIRTPASNAGHVLWAGACDRSDAEKIAERLMRADLFNGWGVRTLAQGVPAFNPLGYHVGSVWPHDNALILEGFRRYGMLDRLERLGSALLDAMLAFPDGRIPELFSGDGHDTREIPTPYPVASRPQAWSAAALPWTLISMLGVTPSDSESLHIVRPILPPWLAWARLRNLHFGSTAVDLFFRREQGHTGVEVERQDGPGSVVLSRRWPLVPL